MQNAPKPFYGNKTSQNDAMRKAKAEALLKTNKYFDEMPEFKQHEYSREESIAAARKFFPGKDSNMTDDQLYQFERDQAGFNLGGYDNISDAFKARDEYLAGKYAGYSPMGAMFSNPDAMQKWVNGEPGGMGFWQQFNGGRLPGRELAEKRGVSLPDFGSMYQQNRKPQAPSIMGGGNNLLGNAFTNPVKKLI